MVQIGPVPADSAVAYCELCRDRLARLVDDPALEAILTEDVQAQFGDLLDQWETAAHHDPFVWSAEFAPETVEHTFFVFFQCIRRSYALYDDSRSPEEIRLRTPFRIAMTNAVLDALEAEGKGSSELAGILRESWPDDDIS